MYNLCLPFLFSKMFSGPPQVEELGILYSFRPFECGSTAEHKNKVDHYMEYFVQSTRVSDIIRKLR